MNNSNKQSNFWISAWRRIKKNKLALWGFCIILFMLFIAVFAPLVATHDPLEQNFKLIRSPMSFSHFFGCDQLGRDIFSRIIYGTKVTLQISMTAVLLGLIIGTIFGMIGGYYGGKIDILIVYVTDILLAFPGLILALALVAVVGPGITGVIVASGFSSIPQFIRFTRAIVLSENEKDYVMAAKSIGENNIFIMTREILPNCIAPLLVLLTLRMAVIILIASGLSFLGLGAQPPTPEWGAMLNEGRGYLQTAPHLSLFPGLMIMLLVLAFNLAGDGLRDVLDPRMKI